MLSKLLVTSTSILPPIVMLRKKRSIFVSRFPIRFKKNRRPREGLIFVDTRIGAASKVIEAPLAVQRYKHFCIEVPVLLNDNHLLTNHYINIDEDYLPDSLGVFAHEYSNLTGTNLESYTVSSPAILNDLSTGLYFFIAHPYYDHIEITSS